MKNINFLKDHGVDVEKSIELFGDIELYNSTIEDFLDGIDVKIERLKTFKGNSEIANYAIFAHSVKSDARYLGFDSVAAIALEHELAGKDGNEKFINENYDNFCEAINQMIKVSSDYLNDNDCEDNIIKKNIVVVDDAPLITNIVKNSLESKFNLVIFNNSKEAADYILNNKDNIDVLLLDLNMPELDGFDILKLMHTNNLFQNIKVSIITGDESKETIDKAFMYPIIDMLNKPFSVENLKTVIDKTLQ
ncbi:MAG: response regulator [bacterium]